MDETRGKTKWMEEKKAAAMSSRGGKRARVKQ